MMFRHTVFLTALLALVVASPERGHAQSTRCTIAFVIDGDTVHCRDGEKVRLLSIDAPDRGRFGAIARNALAALLPPGRAARLELDKRVRDGDGRLLAYVFLDDGRMVNEMMLSQGYAFLAASKDNRRYAERMRAAEAAARTNKRGVWSR